jgi:hypothetical protein
MRRALPFLALAGLAWAAVVSPPALHAAGWENDRGKSLEAIEPAVTPIRLTAPAAGATLTAGTTADLAWTPLPSLARLARVEEWEAFLSLDGGATYPLRITPHLDQDLRRVRWQVPAVPAADARLLFRLGDERREVVVKLPQRFTIVAAPVLETPFLLAGVAPSRGEPALPGSPGVLAWVTGSRRGGALRQMIAAAGPGWQPRVEPAAPADETTILADGRPLLPLPVPARESAAHGPMPVAPSRLASAGEGPLQASDILLLIQRQNE